MSDEPDHLQREKRTLAVGSLVTLLAAYLFDRFSAGVSDDLRGALAGALFVVLVLALSLWRQSWSGRSQSAITIFGFMGVAALTMRLAPQSLKGTCMVAGLLAVQWVEWVARTRWGFSPEIDFDRPFGRGRPSA